LKHDAERLAARARSQIRSSVIITGSKERYALRASIAFFTSIEISK